jgi:glutathione S-transferase
MLSVFNTEIIIYIGHAGEHFSPEFTAIAPQQKVPVIDDSGFILTERCLMNLLCID